MVDATGKTHNKRSTFLVEEGICLNTEKRVQSNKHIKFSALLCTKNKNKKIQNTKGPDDNMKSDTVLFRTWPQNSRAFERSVLVNVSGLKSNSSSLTAITFSNSTSLGFTFQFNAYL